MRCTTWPTSRRGASRAERQCRRLPTRALRRGGHNDWFFYQRGCGCIHPGRRDRLGAGGRQCRCYWPRGRGPAASTAMRAILVGILAPSNCIRRVDSAVLQIIGPLLAGGILLLWDVLEDVARAELRQQTTRFFSYYRSGRLAMQPDGDSAPNSEVLSSLIGDIYDTTLDQSLWPSVLKKIAIFVRGAASAVVRRQNISDIRFGKLREYLAHLV